MTLIKQDEKVWVNRVWTGNTHSRAKSLGVAGILILSGLVPRTRPQPEGSSPGCDETPLGWATPCRELAKGRGCCKASPAPAWLRRPLEPSGRRSCTHRESDIKEKAEPKPLYLMSEWLSTHSFPLRVPQGRRLMNNLFLWTTASRWIIVFSFLTLSWFIFHWLEHLRNIPQEQWTLFIFPFTWEKLKDVRLASTKVKFELKEKYLHISSAWREPVDVREVVDIWYYVPCLPMQPSTSDAMLFKEKKQLFGRLHLIYSNIH